MPLPQEAAANERMRRKYVRGRFWHLSAEPTPTDVVGLRVHIGRNAHLRLLTAMT